MMKYISTRINARTRNFISFLVFTILVVLYTIAVIRPSSDGGFLWPSPVIIHESSTAAKWSLSNIYINDNLQPLITAIDGKIIIIGSNDISKASTVMAFNGNSGDLIWQVSSRGLSITSFSSKVIVGGFGMVTALDSERGEVIWRTIVQANVNKIIINNNNLYVFGSASDRYYVLDGNNGNVLEKFNGISSIEQEVLLGNIAYLRNGNGEIFAINKSNNQELWRNKVNAISDLAVTSSAVYALSQNGDLLSLDSQLGFKEESLAMFTPSPFVMYSEQAIEFPYYVAIDPSTNILFVYLGDSAQLFAFHVQ